MIGTIQTPSIAQTTTQITQPIQTEAPQIVTTPSITSHNQDEFEAIKEIICRFFKENDTNKKNALDALATLNETTSNSEDKFAAAIMLRRLSKSILLGNDSFLAIDFSNKSDGSCCVYINIIDTKVVDDADKKITFELGQRPSNILEIEKALTNPTITPDKEVVSVDGNCLSRPATMESVDIAELIKKLESHQTHSVSLYKDKDKDSPHAKANKAFLSFPKNADDSLKMNKRKHTNQAPTSRALVSFMSHYVESIDTNASEIAPNIITHLIQPEWLTTLLPKDSNSPTIAKSKTTITGSTDYQELVIDVELVYQTADPNATPQTLENSFLWDKTSGKILPHVKMASTSDLSKATTLMAIAAIV